MLFTKLRFICFKYICQENASPSSRVLFARLQKFDMTKWYLIETSAINTATRAHFVEEIPPTEKDFSDNLFPLQTKSNHIPMDAMEKWKWIFYQKAIIYGFADFPLTPFIIVCT